MSKKSSNDNVDRVPTYYYAVKIGKRPGIYRSWDRCQEQIKGYSGSVFKKFDNKKDAEEWKEGRVVDTYDKDLGRSLRDVSLSRKEKLHVYTDGSCPNNGRKDSVGGCGIHFDTDEYEDVSHRLEDNATNNRAELMAIKMAIIILMNDILDGRDIELYTDSEYSIKALTEYGDMQSKRGWKTTKGENVLNMELIRPSYDIFQRYKNIRLFHVRAHTGKKDKHSIGNDLADNLAWTAATGGSDSREKTQTSNYIFQFGKYKGMTVEKVFETDPNYIVWLKKNKTMPNLAKYNRFIESLP